MLEREPQAFSLYNSLSYKGGRVVLPKSSRFRECALLIHTRALFRAKPAQRFACRTESTPLSFILRHRRSPTIDLTRTDDSYVTLLQSV